MEENMQLIVSNIQEQKAITFNYEQLKNLLNGKLEIYENTVYTEEEIPKAKDDRAKLNKLSKALNDEKKRVKNELLKPYMDFETKIKDLISITDNVTAKVDSQIKAFEEKDKQIKLQEIIKYFEEKNVDYKELIDFDNIFQEEWLNKTYTMKKVQMDIDHILARTKMDIESLENSFEDKVILQQAKQFYFANINQSAVLSLTMQKINEIKEFNNKIAEVEQETGKNEIKTGKKIDNDVKVGRVFKLICTFEKLKALNDFLVNQGGYTTEVIERFEVKEEG